jgi:hypothetical protein
LSQRRACALSARSASQAAAAAIRVACGSPPVCPRPRRAASVVRAAKSWNDRLFDSTSTTTRRISFSKMRSGAMIGEGEKKERKSSFLMFFSDDSFLIAKIRRKKKKKKSFGKQKKKKKKKKPFLPRPLSPRSPPHDVRLPSIPTFNIVYIFFFLPWFLSGEAISNPDPLHSTARATQR